MPRACPSPRLTDVITQGQGGGLRMLVPCAKYCMLSNAHGVHRGSSCPQCSRRPKHILRAVSLCGNAQISVSKIDQ